MSLWKINGVVFDPDKAALSFYDYSLANLYDIKPDAPKAIRACDVTVGVGEYGTTLFQFFGADAETLEAMVNERTTKIPGKNVSLEDYRANGEEAHQMKAQASNGLAVRNSPLLPEREKFIADLLENGQWAIDQPIPEDVLRSLHLDELRYLMRLQVARVSKYIGDELNDFQRLQNSHAARDEKGRAVYAVNYNSYGKTLTKFSYNEHGGREQKELWRENGFTVPGKWMGEFREFVAKLKKADADAEELRRQNQRDNLIAHLSGQREAAAYNAQDDNIPF